MGFKFPWTNFHEPNFDWMLKQWKEIYNKIPTKVSQLINDRHFINSEEAPVQSVNGATGHVIIPSSPPEIFECQYGTTTWAAIENARTEGKIPYVNYFGTLYIFTETISADGHYFSAFPKDQLHKMIKCAGDNTWSLLHDVVQDLYWCTYGSTTNAEIEQALTDGKFPVFESEGHYYLYAYKDNVTIHRFESMYGTATYFAYCNNNSWTKGITSLATLASPTFTGTPKAPTAAAGTDTTQIATTAFVQQEIANYIPLNGSAYNYNPVADLNDFKTGIALFTSPTTNMPDAAGWWMVISTANAYGSSVQYAVHLYNTQNPKIRNQTSGNWSAWYDLPGNDDSGWIEASFTADFQNYGTTNKCQYRKVGNVVTVCGAATPVNEITGGTSQNIMFTLPTGYRPKVAIAAVMQGSGTCKWQLNIGTTGNVSFSRYSDESGFKNAPGGSPGAWLPFYATFIIA